MSAISGHEKRKRRFHSLTNESSTMSNDMVLPGRSSTEVGGGKSSKQNLSRKLNSSMLSRASASSVYVAPSPER